jgi:hypothetical protein
MGTNSESAHRIFDTEVEENGVGGTEQKAKARSNREASRIQNSGNRY